MLEWYNTCFLRLFIINHSIIIHSFKGIWANAIVRVRNCVVVQIAIPIHIPGTRNGHGKKEKENHSVFTINIISLTMIILN